MNIPSVRTFSRLGRKPEIVLPVGSSATIVVPSKYPDIFEGCRSSLEQFAPIAPKILVRDGEAIASPEGWMVLQGPSSSFCYAHNVNLGIQACSGDVLLMNDDCQFTKEGSLEALQGVFALRPDIGILSPNVDGIANGVAYARELIQETKHYLSFVCVLIRRSVFDKIGLLDEKYTGYGSEDVDFCRRAQHAGITLAITSATTVKHAHCSSSYIREHALERKRAESAKLYIEKWGRLTPGHYSDEI